MLIIFSLVVPEPVEGKVHGRKGRLYQAWSRRDSQQLIRGVTCGWYLLKCFELFEHLVLRYLMAVGTPRRKMLSGEIQDKTPEDVGTYPNAFNDSILPGVKLFALRNH